MGSMEKFHKEKNSTRTNLLLLANTECSIWKKTSTAKINSKTPEEVEEYYSSHNKYMIKLKEENFQSNNLNLVKYKKNIKNKFSLQIKENYKKSNCFKINNFSSSNNYEVKIDNKTEFNGNNLNEKLTKLNNSYKKIKYLKENNLNIDDETIIKERNGKSLNYIYICFLQHFNIFKIL